MSSQTRSTKPEVVQDVRDLPNSVNKTGNGTRRLRSIKLGSKTGNGTRRSRSPKLGNKTGNGTRRSKYPKLGQQNRQWYKTFKNMLKENVDPNWLRTHTHTHARTHARTHTHTHSHTHLAYISCDVLSQD